MSQFRRLTFYSPDNYEKIMFAGIKPTTTIAGNITDHIVVSTGLTYPLRCRIALVYNSMMGEHGQGDPDFIPVETKVYSLTPTGELHFVVDNTTGITDIDIDVHYKVYIDG